MKTSIFLKKVTKSIDFNGNLKKGDILNLDSLAKLSIMALFSELEIKCTTDDLIKIKKTDDLIKLAKTVIDDYEK